MDEPLSNLDAKLRTQMRTELQNLQADLETTTIYVTHDQTEAMTMGDRIAILEGGELQQIGTPLECYHLPANQFVAGFIGSPSMNFFDVTRDGNTLSHSGFEYETNQGTVAEIPPDADDLILGIRPEDIRISAESEVNSFPIEVDMIEPLGDQSFIYFTVDGRTYNMSVSGEEYIQEGEKLTVTFPHDRIHLFNAETGDAIKNRVPPKAAIAEASGSNNAGSFAVGNGD